MLAAEHSEFEMLRELVHFAIVALTDFAADRARMRTESFQPGLALTAELLTTGQHYSAAAESEQQCSDLTASVLEIAVADCCTTRDVVTPFRLSLQR